MAKVITVSRTYPSTHPKKEQPTYFVEKIATSLNLPNFDLTENIPDFDTIGYFDGFFIPKHHTIRLGNRWKTGDLASLRIWGNDINPKSGRSGPYHSKQIIIAPDVEVTVYDIKLELNTYDNLSFYIDGIFKCEIDSEYSKTIAKHDGLSLEDLKAWFKYPNLFSGQIICWNKNIKY